MNQFAKFIAEISRGTVSDTSVRFSWAPLGDDGSLQEDHTVCDVESWSAIYNSHIVDHATFYRELASSGKPICSSWKTCPDLAVDFVPENGNALVIFGRVHPRVPVACALLLSKDPRSVQPSTPIFAEFDQLHSDFASRDGNTVRVPLKSTLSKLPAQPGVVTFLITQNLPNYESEQEWATHWYLLPAFISERLRMIAGAFFEWRNYLDR